MPTEIRVTISHSEDGEFLYSVRPAEDCVDPAYTTVMSASDLADYNRVQSEWTAWQKRLAPIWRTVEIQAAKAREVREEMAVLAKLKAKYE